MLKKTCSAALVFVLLLVSYNGSFGWGVWGHQHINRAAVFALPMPLRAFFFDHIDFITIEASIPDVRKYAIQDKNEGPRHFIDLEAYGKHPFEALPEDWDAAKAKYGQNKLVKNGILPWYIGEITDKLTVAFRKRDKVSILFLAADLAHYIGDAYVPLHTSLNYDGQLTGQRGVHALWESFIPELLGDQYNLHTPPAVYIKDPQKEIWRIMRESHALVPAVLASEKKLLDSLPKNRIYELDSLGHIRKNKYGSARFTRDFARAYQNAMHGMEERQMQLAIRETACFWYTAWVNAGKPDPGRLDDRYTRKVHRGALRYQYRLWSKKGKLVGIRPAPEF